MRKKNYSIIMNKIIFFYLSTINVRFFIFNMVDKCDIYKNMDLWVKVHGYGNKKLTVTIFSFLKSANGGFYFFIVRYTEIHKLFFYFSKTAFAF